MWVLDELISGLLILLISGAMIGGVGQLSERVSSRFESGTHLAILNLARMSAINTLSDSRVNISSEGLWIDQIKSRYRSVCFSETFTFSRPELILHASGSPSYSGKFSWYSHGQMKFLSVGVGLTPFSI